MYLYEVADHEYMYSSDARFEGLEVPLLFAKYSTKGHSMHIVFLSRQLPFKHSLKAIKGTGEIHP